MCALGGSIHGIYYRTLSSEALEESLGPHVFSPNVQMTE